MQNSKVKIAVQNSKLVKNIFRKSVLIVLLLGAVIFSFGINKLSKISKVEAQQNNSTSQCIAFPDDKKLADYNIQNLYLIDPRKTTSAYNHADMDILINFTPKVELKNTRIEYYIDPATMPKPGQIGQHTVFIDNAQKDKPIKLWRQHRFWDYLDKDRTHQLWIQVDNDNSNPVLLPPLTFKIAKNGDLTTEKYCTGKYLPKSELNYNISPLLSNDPSSVGNTYSGSLPVPLDNAGLAVNKDGSRSIIFGGIKYDKKHTGYYLTDEVIEYNSNSNQAKIIAKLPAHMDGVSAVWNENNNSIYLIGGRYNSDSAVTNRVMRFDLSSHTFSPVTNIPYYNLGATSILDLDSNQLYIVGGISKKVSTSNYVFGDWESSNKIIIFDLNTNKIASEIDSPYPISIAKSGAAQLVNSNGKYIYFYSVKKNNESLIEYNISNRKFTHKINLASDSYPYHLYYDEAKKELFSIYGLSWMPTKQRFERYDLAKNEKKTTNLETPDLSGISFWSPSINKIISLGGYNYSSEKIFSFSKPEENSICTETTPVSFFNLYNEPKIDERGSTVYYPANYNTTNTDPYGASQNIGVRYSLPNSSAKYTMEKKIGSGKWATVKDLAYIGGTSSYIYVEKIPSDKNIKEYQFRVKVQTKDCKIAYSNNIKRTPNPFQWRIDSFKANRDKTSGNVALSWNLKNAISSTANPQKVNFALYRTSQNGLTNKIYSSDASGSSSNPTGQFTDISTNKFESYSYQLKIFYPKEGITSTSKIVDSDYITIEQANGKDIVKVDTLVPPPPPPPIPDPEIISFSSDKLTISSGESVKLTWVAKNASAISISSTNSSGEIFPLSVNPNLTGSIDNTPLGTTNYNINASSVSGKMAKKSLTITVMPKPASPIINSFYSEKSTLNEGEKTKLVWNTQNATKCALWEVPEGYNPSYSPGYDPFTDANKIVFCGANSSKEIQPVISTKYYLKVGNDVSSVSSLTKIFVAPQTKNPVITSFYGQQSLYSGDSTTLSWKTEKAKTCTLSSTSDSSKNVDCNSTETLKPTTNTTYTLKAEGAKGTTPHQKTLTVDVYPKVESPKILSFSSNKLTVEKGQNVLLSWEIENASSCVLSSLNGKYNFGGVNCGKSSKTIAINEDVKLTLFATSKDNIGVSSVLDIVTTDPKPVVTLSTSSKEITFGDTFTLSTTLTNQPKGKVSCYIPFGEGNVVTTKDCSNVAFEPKTANGEMYYDGLGKESDYQTKKIVTMGVSVAVNGKIIGEAQTQLIVNPPKPKPLPQISDATGKWIVPGFTLRSLFGSGPKYKYIGKTIELNWKQSPLDIGADIVVARIDNNQKQILSTAKITSEQGYMSELSPEIYDDHTYSIQVVRGTEKGVETKVTVKAFEKKIPDPVAPEQFSATLETSPTFIATTNTFSSPRHVRLSWSFKEKEPSGTVTITRTMVAGDLTSEPLTIAQDIPAKQTDFITDDPGGIGSFTYSLTVSNSSGKTTTPKTVDITMEKPTPPLTPTDVQGQWNIEKEPSQLQISWVQPSSKIAVDQYIIELISDDVIISSQKVAGSLRSYDFAVDPTKIYSFKVMAIGKDGLFSNSVEVGIKPIVTKPLPLENGEATWLERSILDRINGKPAKLELAWDRPNDRFYTIDNYEIYKQNTDSNSSNLVGTTKTNQYTVDYPNENGEIYQIVGVTSKGAKTDTLNIYIYAQKPDIIPTPLTIKVVPADTTAEISWTFDRDYPVYQDILRKNVITGEELIVATLKDGAQKTNSYTDTNIPAGEYIYQVITKEIGGLGRSSQPKYSENVVVAPAPKTPITTAKQNEEGNVSIIINKPIDEDIITLVKIQRSVDGKIYEIIAESVSIIEEFIDQDPIITQGKEKSVWYKVVYESSFGKISETQPLEVKIVPIIGSGGIESLKATGTWVAGKDEPQVGFFKNLFRDIPDYQIPPESGNYAVKINWQTETTADIYRIEGNQRIKINDQPLDSGYIYDHTTSPMIDNTYEVVALAEISQRTLVIVEKTKFDEKPDEPSDGGSDKKPDKPQEPDEPVLEPRDSDNHLILDLYDTLDSLLPSNDSIKTESGGQKDKVLSFKCDKTSLDVPVPEKLKGAKSFSVEAWMYTNRDHDGMFPIAQPSLDWATYAWGLYHPFANKNPEGISFYVLPEGAQDIKDNADYQKLVRYINYTPYEIQKWNHIVATYDGAKSTLYVNGIAVAQRTDENKAVLFSAFPVRLGGMQNGRWSGCYDGKIDGFRLYDKAIDGQQINDRFDISKDKYNLATTNPVLPKLEVERGLKLTWKKPNSSVDEYIIYASEQTQNRGTEVGKVDGKDDYYLLPIEIDKDYIITIVAVKDEKEVVISSFDYNPSIDQQIKEERINPLGLNVINGVIITHPDEKNQKKVEIYRSYDTNDDIKIEEKFDKNGQIFDNQAPLYLNIEYYYIFSENGEEKISLPAVVKKIDELPSYPPPPTSTEIPINSFIPIKIGEYQTILGVDFKLPDEKRVLSNIISIVGARLPTKYFAVITATSQLNFVKISEAGVASQPTKITDLKYPLTVSTNTWENGDNLRQDQDGYWHIVFADGNKKYYVKSEDISGEKWNVPILIDENSDTENSATTSSEEAWKMTVLPKKLDVEVVIPSSKEAHSNLKIKKISGDKVETKAEIKPGEKAHNNKSSNRLNGSVTGTVYISNNSNDPHANPKNIVFENIDQAGVVQKENITETGKADLAKILEKSSNQFVIVGWDNSLDIGGIFYQEGYYGSWSDKTIIVNNADPKALVGGNNIDAKIDESDNVYISWVGRDNKMHYRIRYSNGTLSDIVDVFSDVNGFVPKIATNSLAVVAGETVAIYDNNQHSKTVSPTLCGEEKEIKNYEIWVDGEKYLENETITEIDDIDGLAGGKSYQIFIRTNYCDGSYIDSETKQVSIEEKKVANGEVALPIVDINQPILEIKPEDKNEIRLQNSQRANSENIAFASITLSALALTVSAVGSGLANSLINGAIGTATSTMTVGSVGVIGASSVVSALSNVAMATSSSLRIFFFGWLPKKRRKGWAKIKNKDGKAILGAIVKLFSIELERVIAQTITDKNGNFDFSIKKSGKYQIIVSATGFENYFSQEKTILENSFSILFEDIILNYSAIALNKKHPVFVWIIIIQSMVNIIYKLRLPIIIIGTIVAIYNEVKYYDFWSLVVVILYILVWAIEIISKKQTNSKGLIFDKSTNLLLEKVIVRLLKENTDSEKLISTTVTDKKGEFTFIVSAGDYRVTAIGFGYKQFVSDIIKVKKEKKISIKIALNKSN